MSKPLSFVSFCEEADASLVLADTLVAWRPSDGVSADAAKALRFALAYPVSAPAENVTFIRKTCRKTRSVFESLTKKAVASGKPCLSSGVLISQIKAAGHYLSAVDALTFPATRGGSGARSRWANPMVNVERIPEIARAFLWPEKFSLADHGITSDVLFDASDALLDAVSLFEDKGHKSALVGFEVEDFTKGAGFLETLQAALPTARETLAANGREYSTALPTSALADALN